MINDSNINYLWSSLIIEELVRCGVEYFCIAPGSRSAPLTVAAARHPKAKHCVHYDERGLAFHALGYACAHKKPVVLICTSGTAGANFYPALIEASKKKVPLIVLSADRPPELRQTGAVQSIDQVGLFGKYVKFSFDLPCPDKNIQPAFVLTTVDQAVFQAVRNPSGVVHLNCMFRDPLAPIGTGEDFKLYLQSIKVWIKGDQPYSCYTHTQTSLPDHEFKAIAQRLEGIKNGLIVAGKVGSEVDQKMVLALAKRLGWPVFADASSGLRLGSMEAGVIHYFDQILAVPKFAAKLKFDGVLHLGGRMTSKRYYEFVSGLALKDYIMVLNHPLRNDPGHQVSLRIEAPVRIFGEAVAKHVKARKRSALLRTLARADRTADVAIEKILVSKKELNAVYAARLISQNIPAGSGLFLGNSMPVRDIDFYGDFKGSEVVVHGNRGASGIDGNVASAVGLSVGMDKPVTVLIGDVALLHDLNSLSMAKGLKHPVVIVVVNNDGGAIFSFLPIARSRDVFERFFTTPHGLSFKEAAAMFGLPYVKPGSPEDFVRSYRNAFVNGRSTIIEIVTGDQDHLRTYQAVQAAIAGAF